MTRYEGIETSVITRLMQKPSAQHDRFSYVFAVLIALAAVCMAVWCCR